jgi:hypothetical protein
MLHKSFPCFYPGADGAYSHFKDFLMAELRQKEIYHVGPCDLDAFFIGTTMDLTFTHKLDLHSFTALT